MDEFMDESNKPRIVFDFELALNRLKQGVRVARKDWKNIKFIFLVQGSEFKVSRAPLNQFFPDGYDIKYNPHIDVVGTDGSVGVWTPTMYDILSNDWYDII